MKHQNQTDQSDVDDTVVEIAAREAARVAIEMWEKERHKETARRADRRLRNTKLLLTNYRSFSAHVRHAVSDINDIEEDSAIYILDMMDTYIDMNNVVIESIKRTASRTAVIVAHIDQMLDIYKKMCESSKRTEDIRRYFVIHSLYVNSNQMSILEIAEHENVDQRTVYRDLEIALDRLAALFFGIDGVRNQR